MVLKWKDNMHDFVNVETRFAFVLNSPEQNFVEPFVIAIVFCVFFFGVNGVRSVRLHAVCDHNILNQTSDWTFSIE